MKTGKCELTLSGHTQPIEAVSTCIVDGKIKLISASRDKTVGNQVKIASGSQDGVVRVWDVHSGECEHILQRQVLRESESTNCMLAPAVLNGELKLVIGFQSIWTNDKNGELLTIWNLQTGKCEHSIPLAKRLDSVFSFQQNGKTYIVMGFMDGVLIFL